MDSETEYSKLEEGCDTEVSSPDDKHEPYYFHCVMYNAMFILFINYITDDNKDYNHFFNNCNRFKPSQQCTLDITDLSITWTYYMIMYCAVYFSTFYILFMFIFNALNILSRQKIITHQKVTLIMALCASTFFTFREYYFSVIHTEAFYSFCPDNYSLVDVFKEDKLYHVYDMSKKDTVGPIKMKTLITSILIDDDGPHFEVYKNDSDIAISFTNTFRLNHLDEDLHNSFEITVEPPINLSNPEFNVHKIDYMYEIHVRFRKSPNIISFCSNYDEPMLDYIYSIFPLTHHRHECNECLRKCGNKPYCTSKCKHPECTAFILPYMYKE